MNGKHYPLYITRPEEINITAETFHDLSYYGLASLLVSWKVVVERLSSGHNIWGRDSILNNWKKYNRFKDLDFFVYRQAELTQIVVPENHKIGKMIEKHFSHRILK